MPFMENQACRDIAQQVSSRNKDTTKPAHGADIALTEDVETNANIAYSCNDVTFTVTDNPSYSTDIAIAPDVSIHKKMLPIVLNHHRAYVMTMWPTSLEVMVTVTVVKLLL